MNKELSFIVSRDVADSIRLEASEIGPKLEREIRTYVREADLELLRFWGKFIPENTKERVKGIEDRIVVLERGAFECMKSDWAGFEECLPSVLGSCFVLGKIVAMSDRESFWNQMYSSFAKQTMTDQLGSAERAKEFLSRLAMREAIIHEIPHQYQDCSQPEGFLECGARYYQRMIMNKLRWGYGRSVSDDAKVNFYERLIQQDGEVVHQKFFGISII
jgi:hypothetical protein